MQKCNLENVSTKYFLSLLTVFVFPKYKIRFVRELLVDYSMIVYYSVVIVVDEKTCFQEATIPKLEIN